MADQLEEFFAAYVEAALWSTNDGSDEAGGEPFDANYDESDLSEECRAAMRADCKQFIDEYGIPPYKTLAQETTEGSDAERAGHDFWMTRNGHGVGFWDRGFPPEIEAKYNAAAESFGEFNLYLGDDGQIHGD